MAFGLPSIGESSWGQKILDSINAVYSIAAEDSGWVTPTLLNSWVNYGAPYSNAQYRKIGNRVHLRGVIKSGTMQTVALTLPVGYRPPAQTAHTVVSNGAAGFAFVNTSGNVTPYAGSNADFSLGGISFLVD